MVIAATVLLILLSIFFVASEYALVGARRTRIEALAKRTKGGAAQNVLNALSRLQWYVAGIQVAITIIGITTGAIVEPAITAQLEKAMGAAVPGWARTGISIVIVAYLMVVLGELLPKYLTVQNPERWALVIIRPLNVVMAILKPLTWLVDKSGSALVRLLGVKPGDESETSREELLLMVQAGSTEGLLDKVQAEMVSKALRFDNLLAHDIMIHRLDIKWIHVDLPKEELISALGKIPHTRVPACSGDIDEMEGVVYLHDVVKHWSDPEFNLRTLLRPVVAVPENLTLDKIVERMRETRTQIVIVVDEYGGTSGLITLEDVVEEIFGELEDRLESERPVIEVFPSGRISARSEVRMDELVSRLEWELPEDPSTDTLAQIVFEALDRVPRPGDQVETEIGLLRVENMARRRITRVSITPKRELLERPKATEE